jgi:hypothetical protein
MNRPRWVAIVGGLALFAVALFIGYRANHPLTIREQMSVYVVGLFALTVIIVTAVSRWRGPRSGLLTAGALAMAVVVWLLWALNSLGRIVRTYAVMPLPAKYTPTPPPRDQIKVVKPVETIPPQTPAPVPTK